MTAFFKVLITALPYIGRVWDWYEKRKAQKKSREDFLSVRAADYDNKLAELTHKLNMEIITDEEYKKQYSAIRKQMCNE